jgi:hypothetical protein
MKGQSLHTTPPSRALLWLLLLLLPPACGVQPKTCVWLVLKGTGCMNRSMSTLMTICSSQHVSQ